MCLLAKILMCLPGWAEPDPRSVPGVQIEEAEVSHTRYSLELLTTAHELNKRSNVQTGRLMQHLNQVY